MSFAQILLLSVALAMDATAAAAARGCAARSYRFGELLRVALLFGGAQALMPVIGWAFGAQLGPAVETYDHWVAFVVLAGVGGKMLLEARRQGEDQRPEDTSNFFGWRVLVILSIATSIDAFVVGLTLPMMQAPFMLSIVTIGVVTALLSALGVLLGQRFGRLLGPRLDAFGGLLLILLGVKILVEHLTS